MFSLAQQVCACPDGARNSENGLDYQAKENDFKRWNRRVGKLHKKRGDREQDTRGCGEDKTQTRLETKKTTRRWGLSKIPQREPLRQAISPVMADDFFRRREIAKALAVSL